jgi:peptide/nickel transport system ATP-binding protein
MSLIFITHDLGIIAEIADHVAVMYQGEIVETGSVWEIFSNPQHPYTKGLLACRPRPDQRLQLLPTVSGLYGGGRQRGWLPPFAKRTMDSHPGPVPGPGHRCRLKPSGCRPLEAKNGPLLAVENLQVGYPVRGVW